MKSNKILYSIVSLLLLIVGFLTGSLLNNNGRYQSGEMYSILGTTEARISEYKKGKRGISIKKLREWCEILQIDIKKLF